MRFLPRLCLAAALAAPFALAPVGPALACSCTQRPAERVIRQADAVVAGRIVGERVADPTTTVSTFEVRGVYEGRVPATIELTASLGPGGGSSCAVVYPVGSVVDPLVLRRADDGDYVVDPCAFLALEDVRELLGEARPPPPPTGGTTPAVSPVVPVAGVPSSGRGPSVPAIVGGLLVALALMAWTIRRSSTPSEEAAVGAATEPPTGEETPPAGGETPPPNGPDVPGDASER